MSSLISPLVLRAPTDLEITSLHPQRVLIVGSCLSEEWAGNMKTLPNPCESDLYLLDDSLPEQPECPIESYDFQIIQLPLRHILPDAGFARLGQTDGAGHRELFTNATNGMRHYLASAMRWNRSHGILTFVFPFMIPMQNAVGRLMPRYNFRNPVYFVERLNEALANELRDYSNSFLFDLNEIHAFYGRRYVQDDHLLALNHGGYCSDFDFQYDQNRVEPALAASEFYEHDLWPIFLASWRELIAMYRTIRQVDMVKMVVLDLDDTLWRGVVGELDNGNFPTSEGWPKGLWEALLFLKRRGVLLAIISKNDEPRIKKLWHDILRGDLELDDFAIIRINWKSKPENLADILAQVNLLPRNIVYIDDNPAERAAITAAFPEIRVLGGTPLTWRRILLWAPEMQVAHVTRESAVRTDMVRAQVVREELRQSVSREEFLASLNIRMLLYPVVDVNHRRFPRVLELINKTNQFNTTGKRWTQEECGTAFAGGTVFYVFELSDRYTDYGLVGVTIVDRSGIPQFVMSCRVLGLEAERAALSKVLQILEQNGKADIFCAMVATDRNLPCRKLYQPY